MKTNTNDRQASVVLKDGNIHVAAWTQSFDKRPTVGEILEIPARFQENLAGYEPRAVVSRIELRAPHADRIDLVATCRMKSQDRPVIVINSDRIRESLRGAAEAHVRSALRFPLINWESSTAPDPVVRFHDPVSGRKSCPPHVRAGLIDLLYPPASNRARCEEIHP